LGVTIDDWKYISPHVALFDHKPTPRMRGYVIDVTGTKVKLPKRVKPKRAPVPVKPHEVCNEFEEEHDELDNMEMQWSKNRLRDSDIEQYMGKELGKTMSSSRGNKSKVKPIHAIDWRDRSQIFTWRINCVPDFVRTPKKRLSSPPSPNQGKSGTSPPSLNQQRRPRKPQPRVKLPNLRWSSRDDVVKISKAYGPESPVVPVLPKKFYVWSHPPYSVHLQGAAAEPKEQVDELSAFEKGVLAREIQAQFMRTGELQ